MLMLWLLDGLVLAPTPFLSDDITTQTGTRTSSGVSALHNRKGKPLCCPGGLCPSYLHVVPIEKEEIHELVLHSEPR